MAQHRVDVDGGLGQSEAYAGILCEFLEVAIHFILYIREIYPAALFQRRRKYNIPVYVCGHPELNQYIRNVVDDIAVLLETGQVNHVAVLIKNDNIPVEKYVFQADKGKIIEISSGDGCFMTLERDLRALLLKISVSETLLQPIPPDCTFTVQVSTSESVAATIEQNFPWISEDTSYNTSTTIIPIKSFTNDIMKIVLHVEQFGTSDKKRQINKTSTCD